MMNVITSLVLDCCQNAVTCQITGDSAALQYFDIDPSTCLIRVSVSLATDVSRSTEYTVSTNCFCCCCCCLLLLPMS